MTNACEIVDRFSGIGIDGSHEPVYTEGRTYFNLTGGVCNKKTNESYSLMIILICDYSSHVAQPMVLMPYVSYLRHNVGIFWFFVISTYLHLFAFFILFCLTYQVGRTVYVYYYVENTIGVPSINSTL